MTHFPLLSKGYEKKLDHYSTQLLYYAIIIKQN